MTYKEITEAILGFFVIMFGIFQGMVALKKSSFKIFSRKEDLSGHTFFFNMQSAILYKIPSLAIKGDPAKTDIMKIYAHVKLQIFYDEMVEFVRAFNANGRKHCFSQTDVLQTFDKTIVKYRREAIQKISEKYNNKVAFLFDERFTNGIHLPIINITRQGIEDICKSEFYPKCSEKISAMLDMFTFAFQYTIIDLERTCKSLNGELSKELEKLGYERPKYQEYVTLDRFEMSENTQNMMLKELKTKRGK